MPLSKSVFFSVIHILAGVATGHDALPVPPGSRALPAATALSSQPPGGQPSGGFWRRLSGAELLQKMLSQGRGTSERGRKRELSS